MNNIIFDNYNDKSIDPNIIFNGLQFRLKKFNFDKDILFKNMTKIKSDDTMEYVMSLVSYEFNYDNIIDKIKELFPSGFVDISDTMFVQLYLYLISMKTTRFIFKREIFESFHYASMQVSKQTIIDKRRQKKLKQLN